MPAEWQPHRATWLSWPKDPETWPDRVPQVEDIFLQMMAALAPHEKVNLLVDDEASEQAVRARCNFAGAQKIHFHRCARLIPGYVTTGRTFSCPMNFSLTVNCGGACHW